MNLLQGDCLELMKDIPDGSIDMILADHKEVRVLVNNTLEVNKIYQGDCLELMQYIPDKSIDMILADLP